MDSRLRELRLKKKASQGEVADAIHVTRQAYSFYESGKREPSLEMVKRLADYFGVTIDYLTGRSDIPVTPESLQIPNSLLQQMKEASPETIAEIWQYLNYFQAQKKKSQTGTEKS